MCHQRADTAIALKPGSFGAVALAASGVGSRVDGSLVSYAPCANNATDGEGTSCDKGGSQLCAKCRMVKYCSKECQRKHWSQHRAFCNGPYLKSTWVPQWVQHDRQPAFIGGAQQVKHGMGGQYLWGNVPAIDYLNVPMNERDAAVTADLNLYFAASGDIRNAVSTVNGLPPDFRGRCDILMNDFNPFVAGRNIVLLHILAGKSGIDVEEAAELALHLQYSASLTSAQAVHVLKTVTELFTTDESWLYSGRLEMTRPSRGAGLIRSFISREDLLPFLGMALSTYGRDKAERERGNVMLAESRLDYRERYMAGLKPSHRQGFFRYRETGVLLPVSESLAPFKHPNRLLFDADGKWMSMDSASPLFGWDLRAVLATGKYHRCPEGDVYGSLFFHLKSQFAEFGRRMRDFKIDFRLTCLDAIDLASGIISGTLPVIRSNLPCRFDRIDTSNICDTIGMAKIVQDWAPLLKKENKHAALTMYSMNWTLRIPAQDRADQEEAMLRAAQFYNHSSLKDLVGMQPGDTPGNPRQITRLGTLDAFHSYEAEFKRYIEQVGLNNAVAQANLTIRKRNLISPKRCVAQLDSDSTKVPPCSVEDIYLLGIIGGMAFQERFIEIQAAA